MPHDDTPFKPEDPGYANDPFGADKLSSYCAWIYEQAHRILKVRGDMNSPHPDAAEIAQNTCHKLLTCAGKFRGEGTPHGFIFGILKNEAHAIWRQRKRLAAPGIVPMDDDANEAGLWARLEGEYAQPHRSEPEAADAGARSAERKAAVRAALAKLSPGQRRAIELWRGGMSYEEAAQTMNMPVGTAKSHVHRAIEKMTPMLAAFKDR